MPESFGADAGELFGGFSFKNLANLKELNLALAREHREDLGQRTTGAAGSSGAAGRQKPLAIHTGARPEVGCLPESSSGENSKEDLVSPTELDMVDRWDAANQERSADSLSSCEDALSPHARPKAKAQQSPPSLLGFSVNE